MPKVKPTEAKTMTQRLTVRMQWEDWRLLRELQLVLRMPTPGHTVRTLIRMHAAAERAALKRLRKDVNAVHMLKDIIDAEKEP